MSTLSTYLNKQQFLIPPFDRLKFVIIFVLMIGLSRLAVGFLFRYLPTSVFVEQEVGIGNAIISGFVTGTVVGATQWLILRKYLSSWLWIPATAAGQIILSTTFQGWLYFLSTTLPLATFDGVLMDMNYITIYSGFVFAFCIIWLGLTQWLVLRHYVKSAWWWIVFNFMAPFFSVCLIILVSFPNYFIRGLQFDSSIIAPFTVAATQAIGLCTFHKKSSIVNDDMQLALSSPFFMTPEIKNYRKVKALSRRLYSKINQAWQADMTTNRTLSYLVGVGDDGEILVYKPINSASRDFISQTPLPNLVDTYNLETEAEYNQQALAPFRVIFVPPGHIEVNSLRSVSLLWLGIILAVVIILMSSYPTLVAQFD